MSLEFEYYVICIVAGLYTAVSRYITVRFGNQQKMEEIKRRMDALTREYKKASSEKNDAEMRRIEKEQQKILPEMMGQSLGQIKPLIIIFPLIILLSAALKAQFPDFAITLPFSLPIIVQNLDKFPNWRDTFGAYGWFWVSVIFISMASQLLVSAAKKFNEKPKGGVIGK
ncbi:MAG: EMC3/TMCO1 family protein [Candidatus Micrarchaeota archaeon]|nr:EMC3/TMCO1 family protein [Candidatus Micrarchaeota archaeon]